MSATVLTKDCDVTLVPSGQRSTLATGESVTVIQALGGTVTVRTSVGLLARLSNEDAAALGLSESGSGAPTSSQGPFEFEDVIDQLKTVFDPEIPVNIVDLGLVYACDALVKPDGSRRIEIKMSMTAPGCGMGDVLAYDVQSRVLGVPGVSEVDVEVVWDPPWDQSRLSDAAKLELGFY